MTTLAPAIDLPLTLAEREVAPDIIRATASFEEYLDFAERCEYNVEYIDGEIISMSQASLPHESLVGRIIYILIGLFDDDDQKAIFSSNIKIYIEATGDSVNADVTLVQGEPDYLLLPSGNVSTASVKNPVLLVGVLSESTLAYDLSTKLELYKQIPSLRQILYVSQTKPWVMSYVRSETPDVWLNTSAQSLTQHVPVLDKSVSLSEIYRKMKF